MRKPQISDDVRQASKRLSLANSRQPPRNRIVSKGSEEGHQCVSGPSSGNRRLLLATSVAGQTPEDASSATRRRIWSRMDRPATVNVYPTDRSREAKARLIPGQVGGGDRSQFVHRDSLAPPDSC
jgi:hypothetical protein